MRIGILALQGAFIEHKKMLDRLGVESFEIRQRNDLELSFDGLIIPGGESTVMGKLLHDLRLFSPIKTMIDDGLPVFGTCAGLLLLAKQILNDALDRQIIFYAMKMKSHSYGVDFHIAMLDYLEQGNVKLASNLLRADIESLLSACSCLNS